MIDFVEDNALAKRERRKKRRKKIWIGIGIFFAVLLILCAAALYQGIVNRRYVISSEKLTNTEPIKIVLLTDLHSYIFGKDQQPLIKRIAKLQPDLICLVGDIGDNVRPIEGTELLLEGIVSIAPCVYATGNHEYWGDYPSIFATFERFGVPILHNESMDITLKGQTITLYGIDDPWYARAADYGYFMGNWAKPEDNRFTILLCHRPDPAPVLAEYGFDLMLSGHAHGGQVRIPFVLNGLFAPDQGWYPKYAGGQYQVADTTMVVSRGLAYYPNLPRVFNPLEVVEILLKGK